MEAEARSWVVHLKEEADEPDDVLEEIPSLQFHDHSNFSLFDEVVRQKVPDDDGERFDDWEYKWIKD